MAITDQDLLEPALLLLLPRHLLLTQMEQPKRCQAPAPRGPESRCVCVCLNVTQRSQLLVSPHSFWTEQGLALERTRVQCGCRKLETSVSYVGKPQL